MKRIICLILAFLMILPLAACGGTVNTDAPEETTAAPTEKYDGVFQIGYARANITPDNLPIELQNGTYAKRVQDDIYATCIAAFDGETTALILTIDVTNISDDICSSIRTAIRKATGVKTENVIISATHNHSTPIPGARTDSSSTRWLKKLTDGASAAAKDAVADLADAEIFIAREDTPGMNFPRRYIHEDGSFSGIWMVETSDTPIVRHETEPDSTVQVIKFARENKKDVVIANWQGHAAHAISKYSGAISADFIYYLRSITEKKNDDLLFAYYSGASANLKLNTPIESESVYDDYQGVGRALAEKILDALENLERVEAGKIGIKNEKYVATVLKDDAETLARAKEAEAAAKSAKSTETRDKIIATYGFASHQETTKLISRNEKLGETVDLDLRAVAFGDIAFVAAPYEMFDTNGMEIKDGSPFKMTFVLSCAGGSWGYVPAAHAIEHGGYEVYSTRFVYSTAESVVAEFLSMLGELKK